MKQFFQKNQSKKENSPKNQQKLTENPWKDLIPDAFDNLGAVLEVFEAERVLLTAGEIEEVLRSKLWGVNT